MSSQKKLLLSILFLQFAFATTINVPTDQVTIQGAITVAVAGDTVLVQPGNYVENINFIGKDLVILSASGPEITIINGNQNGSVVLFINNETDAAVLDGFTITNGNGWDGAAYTPRMGGGILVRNGASPILKNLVITNNTADGAGQSPPATGSIGGGILISRNSNPLLDNIIISNNHSNMGGGLAVYQSEPILENITIIENEASNSGGGVYIQNSSPQFNNTLIGDNSAINYGGAVWVHENSTPIFNRTTIAYNTAVQGNAIVLSDNANPVIINSIIWGPDSNPNDVYSYIEVGFDPNSITFMYSDYQLGENGVLGQSITVSWLEGNLSADPLFVAPATQDYTLLANSPCIDAGINTYVLDGETIVELNPDQYSGAQPDMGCFEYVVVGVEPTVALPAELRLGQNYPNPFNPVTSIQYELPLGSFINFAIYDLLGNRIITLVNEYQAAGVQTVKWNARDRYGRPVSAGVYLYQLKGENFSESRKMILLK